MKKKVAFLISSLNTGGAQRAVSNIVTNFPEDWEIDLILNSSDNIVYPYRGNIISLDIKEPKNRMGLIYQGKAFIKRFFLLRKLKKEKGYNAVISFLDSANIVNILTGHRHCKVIISVRHRLSGEKNWHYKLIVNNLVKLLYNRADKVVAISEGVRRDLIENFGVREEKTCTIYNCYNVEEIQEKAAQPCEEVNVESDCLTIATMGRLTHPKGQWHLLRAFSEVLKEEKTAKLYILGDGELKDYLQDMTRELGIEAHVEFCGFLNNPFSVISKAKMFIFPSLHEGFGNALVEAMACEVPCIATDFKYGAREILQENPNINKTCDTVELLEYGVLTPVCSFEYSKPGDKIENEEIMLKDAIIKMWRDDELQKNYAQKAVTGANHFSAQATIRGWLNLLTD